MSMSRSIVVTGRPRRRRQWEASTVLAISRYARTSPLDDESRIGGNAVLKTSEVRSSASGRFPTRAYIRRYSRSMLSRYTDSQSV